LRYKIRTNRHYGAGEGNTMPHAPAMGLPLQKTYNLKFTDEKKMDAIAGVLPAVYGRGGTGTSF